MSFPLGRLMECWKEDTTTEDWEFTSWFQRPWSERHLFRSLPSESGTSITPTLSMSMNWRVYLEICMQRRWVNTPSTQCWNQRRLIIWSNDQLRSSYLDMLGLLLKFTRSAHEANWKLHVECLLELLPWFCEDSRSNNACVILSLGLRNLDISVSLSCYQLYIISSTNNKYPI